MPASEGAVAAQTPQPAEPQPQLSESEARLQRNLKIVVLGLAILLFAGLAAVVGRVIYLASPAAEQSVTQPLVQQPTDAAAPSPAIRPEQSLQLPAGAQVGSISLSGTRIAVHYTVGAEAGIAIFDIATGHLITNVDVEAGR